MQDGPLDSARHAQLAEALAQVFGPLDAAALAGLVVLGAAAGVFALAGGHIAEALLGSSYASDVGKELGRLVVLLSGWAGVSAPGSGGGGGSYPAGGSMSISA